MDFIFLKDISEELQKIIYLNQKADLEYSDVYAVRSKRVGVCEGDTF